MSNRQVLILTNCTNRKRGTPPDGLHARALPKSTYKVVSDEWARRVARAPEDYGPFSGYKAEDLYCGRAITETLRTARILNADVAFLSAGLGVVVRDDLVPPYNLTSSPGSPDSIEGRLTEPYSAAQWWKALTCALKGRTLQRLIEERKPRIILAALPASYLHMVGDDVVHALEHSPPRFRKALRILGPRRASEVPAALQKHWLPYDDRLDNPGSGVNGTTADFPHRALRHFAQQLSDTRLDQSLEEHYALVEQSLHRLKPYVRTRGATASDERVLQVIAQLWDQCDGNRSRVLRELRANSGVACEQSRFRKLADRHEQML